MMFISEGKVIIKILAQQKSQLGTLYEPCQASCFICESLIRDLSQLEEEND